jgi:hypothetical protein
VKIFASFVLTAAIVGAGVHAQRVATDRQLAAQSWSGDNVQFAAVGLTGSTLRTYLPEGDDVRCDAMLDAIRTDSKLVGELRRAGFVRVSCGQRTGELR